jgi:hypothetical protein
MTEGMPVLLWPLLLALALVTPGIPCFPVVSCSLLVCVTDTRSGASRPDYTRRLLRPGWCAFGHLHNRRSSGGQEGKQ